MAGLDAALDDTPVVIVVGPRQAGKSTLASIVAEERGARYVTLDDDGPREAANEDPTGFVENATLPLRRETFIDDLFAGRVAQIANAPISRSAIAGALSTGGYPEAVARRDPRRRGRWFEEYVAMTLERDVRDLVRNAQQLDELPTLLHLAAARISGLLSPTGIARDAGMSRPTVQRYLALLEQLFLLIRARAWSRNIGQRLIKAPKVWLPDTGLACQLLGYDQVRFEEDETALAGALFENFVAMELVKQVAWAQANVRIHHLQVGRHRTLTGLRRTSPPTEQAGSTVQAGNRRAHRLRNAVLREGTVGATGVGPVDASRRIGRGAGSTIRARSTATETEDEPGSPHRR
jgi:predicted AAA+ superfamily ATPase